jgi:hypothetical protein
VVAINNISYLVPAAEQRQLAPAQESGQLQDQARQPGQQAPLPTPLGEGQREQLQVRAVILGRESNPTGLSPRARDAMLSYRTAQTYEERDRISALLGVDEYA